jgi:hypothetical protein
MALSSPLNATTQACSERSVEADAVAAACMRNIKLIAIMDSKPTMTSTPTNAMALSSGALRRRTFTA